MTIAYVGDVVDDSAGPSGTSPAQTFTYSSTAGNTLILTAPVARVQRLDRLRIGSVTDSAALPGGTVSSATGLAGKCGIWGHGGLGRGSRSPSVRPPSP
jgi:hypothetical protein